MRTRFIVVAAALLSFAVALTLPACRLPTDSGTNVTLASGHGSDDSTGTGDPPPPLTGFSIGVSGDSMATAGRLGFLHLFAENHDAAVDTVNYRFTGPQGWPGFPATGSLTVPGKTSATADIPVAVPAATAPGSYLFHFDIGKPNGTALQSGDFSLYVHSS